MLKNLNASPIIAKPVASADSHTHKCILCIPETPLKASKISWHLKEIHRTNYSTKCVDCSFKGSKEEIISHFLVAHKMHDKNPKIVKFILSCNEEIPKEALAAIQAAKKNSKRPQESACIHKLKNTANMFVKRRKMIADKASGNKTTVVNQNRMQSIKSTTFIGPSTWSKKSTEVAANAVSNKEAKEPAAKPISKVTPLASTSSSSATVVSVEPRLTVNSKPCSRKNKEFPLIKIRKLHERDDLPFFCFFCDDLETSEDAKALMHFKEHIGFGFHCNYCDYMDQNLALVNAHYQKAHFGKPRTYHDDKSSRLGDLNWIHDFLENQFKCSLYESEDEDSDDEKGIQCTLCLRAARLDNDKAYSFKSLSKFKSHFLEHSRWNRVDCTKCGKTVTKCEKKMMRHADDHSDTKDPDLFNHRSCVFIDKFIENEFSRKTEEYWNNKKAFYKCRECIVKPEKMDFSLLNFKLKNVDTAAIKTTVQGSGDSVNTITKTKSEVKSINDKKITEESKMVKNRRDSEDVEVSIVKKKNDMRKSTNCGTSEDLKKVIAKTNEDFKIFKKKSKSEDKTHKHRRGSEELKTIKDRTKNEDTKTIEDRRCSEDVKAVKVKKDNEVEKTVTNCRTTEDFKTFNYKPKSEDETHKDRRGSEGLKEVRSKKFVEDKKNSSKLEVNRTKVEKVEKIEKHEKKIETNKMLLKCGPTLSESSKQVTVESIKGKRAVTGIGEENNCVLEKRAKNDDSIDTKKLATDSKVKTSIDTNRRNTGDVTKTIIHKVPIRVKSTDSCKNDTLLSESNSIASKLSEPIEKNAAKVGEKVTTNDIQKLKDYRIKPPADCNTKEKNYSETIKAETPGLPMSDEIVIQTESVTTLPTTSNTDVTAISIVAVECGDSIVNEETVVDSKSPDEKQISDTLDQIETLKDITTGAKTIKMTSNESTKQNEKINRVKGAPIIDEEPISNPIINYESSITKKVSTESEESGIKPDRKELDVVVSKPSDEKQTSDTLDQLKTLKDITTAGNTIEMSSNENTKEDEKINKVKTSPIIDDESISNPTITISNESSITEKVSTEFEESGIKPDRKKLDDLKSSLKPGWVGCGHCAVAFESQKFLKHSKEAHPGWSRYKITPFKSGETKLP